MTDDDNFGLNAGLNNIIILHWLETVSAFCTFKETGDYESSNT